MTMLYVFSCVVQEELIKFFPGAILAGKKRGYMMLVTAIAFGLVEYFLYVCKMHVGGYWRLLPLSVHMMTGVINWYGFDKKREVRALIVNILFHLTYNSILLWK